MSTTEAEAPATEPKRKHRAKPLPAAPVQELEPGYEWLMQLMHFKNPQRYLTTQQARKIIGCSTPTVHEMINSDPPSLDCHTVGVGPNPHYKIYPLSVIRYLWDASNHQGKGSVPVKAAFLLCWTLVHHLPAPALKLLRNLCDTLREPMLEAQRKLKLVPHDGCEAELLAEAMGATPPPPASAPSQEQRSLF